VVDPERQVIIIKQLAITHARTRDYKRAR
jgi:hypothetical protein